ncbi:MAG: hypothetical protein RR573_09070 [Oscillospiraceae bacterium]
MELIQIELVLLGVISALLLWIKLTTVRLSPLFISRFSHIHQSVNCEGIRLIRAHRREYSDKDLNIKLIGMSRFFLLQLPPVIKALELGKVYKTYTHLQRTFERAQKQGILQIISSEKAHRRFLIETIVFLGIVDFIKVLCSKEHRKSLVKQMYNIEIVRTK